jgi:very-short-patch-repair endonuclease
LSYGNQRDHLYLDRHQAKPILLQLAGASVASSPSAESRETHLERLLGQCSSGLEKDWLRFIHKRDLRLPDQAQVLIGECETRPDFLYREHHAAIYVDGPIHEYPDRAERDRTRTSCMEDLGYTVIRFPGDRSTWSHMVERYRYVFGGGR